MKHFAPAVYESTFSLLDRDAQAVAVTGIIKLLMENHTFMLDTQGEATYDGFSTVYTPAPPKRVEDMAEMHISDFKKAVLSVLDDEPVWRRQVDGTRVPLRKNTGTTQAAIVQCKKQLLGQLFMKWYERSMHTTQTPDDLIVYATRKSPAGIYFKGIKLRE